MKAPILFLLPLLSALLTSSCSHHIRRTAETSDRWLLTAADVALLQSLHARPHPQREVGLDGRSIICLNADDYFDDRGMRLAAEKMPNLKTLALLTCQRVTDQGMKHVASFSQLQFLSIDNTTITDLSIRQILHLKELEYLNISGTKVTADGLASLAQLPKLTDIDASRIPLTTAEKAALEKLLGGKIYFR